MKGMQTLMVGATMKRMLLVSKQDALRPVSALAQWCLFVFFRVKVRGGTLSALSTNTTEDSQDQTV